jgi:polyisoprenoid-binding protein YceI
MMIAKVHGRFDKISGHLSYDPAAPEKTSVSATIDSSSINTGEEKRDAHLRSPDFFDVEKFPSIEFQSSSWNITGDSGKITGNLTIHGITKPVVLEVDGPSKEIKDPYGLQRIGASGKTKIKRKDFGLTWNAALEAGGFLVGDDVTIDLDVQFVKQA